MSYMDNIGFSGGFMTQAPPRALWTVSETARFLGMSDNWVYRMSALGHIPCRKIGKKKRFIPEEVENWARNQPRNSFGEPDSGDDT